MAPKVSVHKQELDPRRHETTRHSTSREKRPSHQSEPNGYLERETFSAHDRSRPRTVKDEGESAGDYYWKAKHVDVPSKSSQRPSNSRHNSHGLDGFDLEPGQSANSRHTREADEPFNQQLGRDGDTGRSYDPFNRQLEYDGELGGPFHDQNNVPRDDGNRHESLPKPLAQSSEKVAQTGQGRELIRSALTSFPLACAFAQIAVGDFVSCRTFIQNRPQILEQQPKLFISEAVLAYQRNESQYARACAQQAILIRECQKLNSGDLNEYLRDLEAKHKSTIRRLFEDTDALCKYAKTKADELGASSSGQQSSEPTSKSRHSTRPADGVIYTSTPLPIRRDSGYGGTDPRVSILSDQLAGTRVSRHSRHTSDLQQIPENNNMIAPPPFQSAEFSTRPPSVGYSPRSVASVQPDDYDMRGTPGEAERLDPSYRQRKDPATFYSVGKVFAMLWHENAGQTNRGKTDDLLDPKYRLTDKFGERIFSHIRRMVVVRQRYGYCWCIGINTYGGRGIAGKNRSVEEIQAHTIAYDSKGKPLRLSTEVGMVKEFIAVDMAPNQTLDPMSRLNFAKVYTVEHNVKVKNVGKVADRSIDALRSYWRGEMTD